MRAAAAQALANQAGEKTVLQALLKKLEDENSRVRAAAAQALANQAGEKTVLQALLKKLEDEDSDVRASAALALATQAGDDEVFQSLLSQVERINLPVELWRQAESAWLERRDQQKPLLGDSTCQDMFLAHPAQLLQELETRADTLSKHAFGLYSLAQEQDHLVQEQYDILSRITASLTDQEKGTIWPWCREQVDSRAEVAGTLLNGWVDLADKLPQNIKARLVELVCRRVQDKSLETGQRGREAARLVILFTRIRPRDPLYQLMKSTYLAVSREGNQFKNVSGFKLIGEQYLV